jgi:DNA-binding MarR family transcriptional regulator
MSAFNPENHLINIDAKIVASLEKISEVFRVLLWAEAKEHRVSPIQLQLLIFLKYHPLTAHRRIAFLAREFNLTKATISDSMRVLEEKGLVLRSDDITDSRGYNFSLTEKGEVLTASVENFTGPLDGAIAALTPQQKEYLLSSVLDLIYRLNQMGIISTQRMCFNCYYYEGDRSQNHFCNLVQAPLAYDSIRFECPEHKMKGKA